MAGARLRWDDVEVFCLLAESGSLRQAATATGQSVETLRRRINALEVAMGERLFRRTVHGLSITQAGRDVLCDAQRARSAIDAISRSVGATKRASSRVVRFACPDDLGGLWLLPALLGARSPHACVINADLFSAQQSIDWDRIDVAILYERPDRADLMCRKVGRVGFTLAGRRDKMVGFTASTALPDDTSLILPGEGHPWLRWAKSEPHIASLLERPHASTTLPSSTLKILTSSQLLGVLPTIVLRDEAGLAAASQAYSCETDLWLAFHRDARSARSSGQFIDGLIALVGELPEVAAFGSSAMLPE